MCGLFPVPVGYANQLLADWGHKLGPVNRPFRSEAFALDVDGRPIAVAVSASIVSASAAGYARQEAVDGWEKVREDCGSSGGGAWSRKRSATDAVQGAKTLWLWRYVDTQS